MFSNLNWYDFAAAGIIFILVYRSIRKIQKNAKSNCNGKCSGCSISDCPSKEIEKENK